MPRLSFSKCPTTAQEEQFLNRHKLPYVSSVISHDVASCTLRFIGHFYDDFNSPLPRVARMSKVGIVKILEKVIGPDLNHYGRDSDELANERILAAARLSSPFEPIEPVPPSKLELEMRSREDEKLEADREEAMKLPDYDYLDWVDLCLTPSNVIDIRYVVLQDERTSTNKYFIKASTDSHSLDELK